MSAKAHTIEDERFFRLEETWGVPGGGVKWVLKSAKGAPTPAFAFLFCPYLLLYRTYTPGRPGPGGLLYIAQARAFQNIIFMHSMI